MSAEWKENGPLMFSFKGPLSKYDAAILEAMFDTNVDADIEEAARLNQETKLFKRFCIISSILYPIEIVLFFLLMDRRSFEVKREAQSIYIKFLLNKLSLAEAKRVLSICVSI